MGSHICVYPISKLIHEASDVTSIKIFPKAKKDDNGKPDLSLLPGSAMGEISKAFMYGESRYGRYNFKSHGGMEWTRLIAAIMRHVSAFNDGEDLASDSGLNHIAHAGAGIMMLLDYITTSNGTDNRFKKELTKIEESSTINKKEK